MNIHTRNRSLTALLILIVGATLAFAAMPLMAKTVIWEAATHREDDTILNANEIAGYTIYYGIERGVYGDSITLNDGAATSYDFNIPITVTTYLVITTRDTDGRESVHSNMTLIEPDLIPEVKLPMPPTVLIVTRIGSTNEYNFTFTEPTKYEDGSDIIGTELTGITKYYLFDTHSQFPTGWVRDIPAGMRSFNLVLEDGDHLFDMETETRNVNGSLYVSKRSLMTAVVVGGIAVIAPPNPPVIIQ